MENIEAIRNIIKGNFKNSLNKFKVQMKRLAEDLKFEEAHRIKEKIDVLENYQSKSTIVNPNINNVDVFTIVSDEAFAYVNFLQLSHGSIIRSHTMEIKKKLDETDQELLQLAIVEIRRRFNSLSKEVYLPFPIALEDHLKVVVPKLGDKKKILELSERNAKFFRQDRFKQIKIVDPDRHTNRIMAQMKADLRLSREPRHIECFDNSNIQGSNPVAACVVFKDGKPSKKEYRHYNIKTVTGPDDFASMEEVVYRRYKRMLSEGEPLPQLIVVDGGKGQLSSALQSLDELGIRGKVAIIGIAKRLEELYYPGDSAPLYIDKRSETLKVLQHARNEAHRFGLTHHRNKRSKSTFKTTLTDIPGVGKVTAEELLNKFQSVAQIKKASLAEITEAVGPKRAQAIRTWFDLENK